MVRKQKLRITAAALLALLLLVSCGCSMLSAATPALWRVSSPDSVGEVYLFGSIHAADAEIYPLPDAIMTAYGSCDAVAVEFNTAAFENDEAAVTAAMKELMYTDGSTISDHVSADVLAAAMKKLSKHGSYTEELMYFKPVMWAQLTDDLALEKTSLSYDNGVDTYFMKLAASDGKDILEIESAQSQYAMLGGFSEALSELLLRKAAEENYLQQSANSLNYTFRLWKTGDEELLTNALLGGYDESLSDEERALLEEYDDAVLTKRNAHMADKADEYMRSGLKVFYIVGTAHMLGGDGIVSRLEAMGYTVGRVAY